MKGMGPLEVAKPRRGQNLLSCGEELGSTVWAPGVEPMAYRANLASRAATRSPSAWKSVSAIHCVGLSVFFLALMNRISYTLCNFWN